MKYTKLLFEINNIAIIRKDLRLSQIETLSLIEQGYDYCSKLANKTNTNEACVFQKLKKLKKLGYVESYKNNDNNLRNITYYRVIK